MGRGNSKGYAWAIAAGFFAAMASISAKYFSSQLIKYSMVVVCNVTMWACYTNSLRALSSLQATVTNFATNFLSSGLAGFFLFEESLSLKFQSAAITQTSQHAKQRDGAMLIVNGVFILSKSSIEKKTRAD
ncbi:hypothetical protein V2J09_011671 [Rumex salicifolius]